MRVGVGFVAFVVAVLAGCGPSVSVDLHEVTNCTAAWDAFGAAGLECENACAEPPENFADQGESVPCPATNPGFVETVTCQRTFEFDDVRGCCVIGAERVSFWQCQ